MRATTARSATCVKLGLEVARLKRTAIGAVKLGMLPQGRFRDLTPDEVRRLRAAAQKKGNAQNSAGKQNAANQRNGGKQKKPLANRGAHNCRTAMTDGEETLNVVRRRRRQPPHVLRLFRLGRPISRPKPDPMTTFVLDTLMRSAASFGETNGMNHIRTAFPDFFDFFKQRGFAVAEDHAEAPMSLIVHYE